MALARLLYGLLLLSLAASCRDERTSAQLTDALVAASMKCRVSEVRELLRKGASVDGEGTGDLPLRVAAVNGHVACVKELLDAGADPTRTIRVENPGGQAMVFRTIVSVQAGLHMLRLAQGTPPDLLDRVNPELKRVRDSGVTVQALEEIIRLLEEAEKKWSQRSTPTAPPAR